MEKKNREKEKKKSNHQNGLGLFLDRIVKRRREREERERWKWEARMETRPDEQMWKNTVAVVSFEDMSLFYTLVEILL